MFENFLPLFYKHFVGECRFIFWRVRHWTTLSVVVYIFIFEYWWFSEKNIHFHFHFLFLVFVFFSEARAISPFLSLSLSLFLSLPLSLSLSLSLSLPKWLSLQSTTNIFCYFARERKKMWQRSTPFSCQSMLSNSPDFLIIWVKRKRRKTSKYRVQIDCPYYAFFLSFVFLLLLGGNETVQYNLVCLLLSKNWSRKYFWPIGNSAVMKYYWDKYLNCIKND